MASRHRSRQRAVQVLYQWDMRKQDVEDAIASYYDTLYSEESEEKPDHDGFMEELVKGASFQASELDQRIGAHSEHWRVERMPAVDRNILRLAVFEMVNLSTPPAVVIDEALELARMFSGDESVSFINGVLDAVRQQLKL